MHTSESVAKAQANRKKAEENVHINHVLGFDLNKGTVRE